jgi:hypothetical protein
MYGWGEGKAGIHEVIPVTGVVAAAFRALEMGSLHSCSRKEIRASVSISRDGFIIRLVPAGAAAEDVEGIVVAGLDV